MKIKHIKAIVAVIFLAALLFSCANQVPPSGGPVDELPPAVSESSPANGAVNVGARTPVSISFSEWVSAASASGAVSVYPPLPQGVAVKTSKNKLRVIPKEPWNDNTTYHIVVGTAFKDLHGNALVNPINIVFSTGAVLDSGRLDGVVVPLVPFKTLPRVALYPESGEWADSNYFSRPAYVAHTDSAGAFAFAHLREGKYRVTAFYDTYRFGRLVAGDTCFTSLEQTIAVTKAEQTIRLYPAESGKAADSTQTGEAADSLSANKKADSLRAGKTTEPDTLPLKLKSYLPKGLASLMPELRLIWSKPARVSLSMVMAIDTAEGDSAAFYIAAAGKHSDTTLLASAKRLKPGLAYRLSIPAQAVKDTSGKSAIADTVKSDPAKGGAANDSGNIASDSTAKDTAKIADIKQNTIDIIIKTLPADSLCYRLHGAAECLEPHGKRKWVYTPTGRDEKFTVADKSGAFSFDSIPASKGTLLWFIDDDGDNSLTPGKLIPWRAPERFFAVPDTIEAKARWEIENLQIKGCE